MRKKQGNSRKRFHLLGAQAWDRKGTHTVVVGLFYFLSQVVL